MTVTPHDNNTFLVTSDSREGDHITDLNENTCSCEAFSNPENHGELCKHLEATIRFLAATGNLKNE